MEALSVKLTGRDGIRIGRGGLNAEGTWVQRILLEVSGTPVPRDWIMDVGAPSRPRQGSGVVEDPCISRMGWWALGCFVHPGDSGALGVLRIKQGGVGHSKGEALNAPAERLLY